MQNKVRRQIEKKLYEIALHSYLYGNTSFNASLPYGKLGVAIFLFHYGRYTNDVKRENDAYQFLCDVLNSAKYVNAIEVAGGYSGIGIGIEYLASAGFIDDDLDEVLSECDLFLEEFMNDVNQLFISSYQLVDVGTYFLWRFKNKKTNLKVKYNNILLNVVDQIEVRTKECGVCDPKIVKFLTLLLPILPNKVKPLIDDYLMRNTRATSWYRYDIWRWEHTFFYPENNILAKIIRKNILENIDQLFDSRSDSVYSGNAGKILWASIIQTKEDVNIDLEKIQSESIELLVKSENLNTNVINCGLKDGYVGVGLTLLSLLDNECKAWIKLL